MTGATGRPELFRSDVTQWVIGPYHAALSGPMRISLKLDGEVIVDGVIETGFSHRGLEKSFELHPWISSVAYADRLDSEGSVFAELALCLAVEEICELKVTPRAQAIRLILAELTRISSHLAYLARMARAASAETALHYILRDREKVLDLFELITGSRFNVNFLRFGGVASDVTEGFIERVVEICELVRIRIKEYNDLFSFNHSFLKRTVGVGVITAEQAKRHGVTGPNARASGVSLDYRKGQPGLSVPTGYEKIDFEICLGTGDLGVLGDAHDRFLLRLRELSTSIEILRQLAESVPFGEYAATRVTRDFAVPRGEAYARVESARGLLGCYVASDGTDKPARVQFRTPSIASISLLPELLVGSRVEDIPILIASLDLSVSEVDR